MGKVDKGKVEREGMGRKNEVRVRREVGMGEGKGREGKGGETG